MHKLFGAVVLLLQLLADLLSIGRLFLAMALNKNALLVVESNRCHQEVLIGLHTALQLSSIKTIVVINRIHQKESGSLFKSSHISPIYFSYIGIRFFVSKVLIYFRRTTFLSSAWDYVAKTNIFDSWLRPLAERGNVAAIIHNLKKGNITNVHKKLAADGRLFWLSSENNDTHQLKPLPILFQQYNYKSSSYNPRNIKFVIPGVNGIDFGIVYSELAKLPKTIHWTISVLGNLNADQLTFAQSDSRIIYFGRVDSIKFIDVTCDADYLIAPTDVTHYVSQNKVSGSLQLSRTYCIPLIIHESLRSIYSLPAESCMSFKTFFNDEIMSKIKKISLSEYNQICRNLKRYQDYSRLISSKSLEPFTSALQQKST